MIKSRSVYLICSFWAILSVILATVFQHEYQNIAWTFMGAFFGSVMVGVHSWARARNYAWAKEQRLDWRAKK